MTQAEDAQSGDAQSGDEKMRYEDVVFERAPCPLCGAQEPGEVILVGRDDAWRKKGSFPLVPCGSCGLVYQCPRPSPETMRYYYEDCYSGKSKEDMRHTQLESPLVRLLNYYRIATIEKVRKLAPGQRVLDVGASYGGFIEMARVKRGVEAWAIDLDPGSIEGFVNKEDIQVTCGDLLEVAYPSDHFDVVTLFETLEHVYSPVQTLEEVKRILKPGGLVSVEVPNWDSWVRPLFGTAWFPLLLPTHLQHFSRHHLRLCAQQAGLEVMHQQAMWFPTEMTLSMLVVIIRAIGHVEDEDKGPGRKIVDGLVGIFLLLLFLVVEVPILLLLRMIGRSGHQTVVARKPLPQEG
jgi:2-polyprenyl-3-methyl-5-hydroxy-6-metoxy-1,4-benzoquinol methylase